MKLQRSWNLFPCEIQIYQWNSMKAQPSQEIPLNVVNIYIKKSNIVGLQWGAI